MVDAFYPETLEEALKIRAKTGAIPYAGGTDLMVGRRREETYLFLNKLDELRQIKEDESFVRIGAGVTFSEALDSPLIPDIMKEALSGIGAPAIRNAGTFGGNLGNGSAKADSVLIEYVCDAKIRLANENEERIVPVSDFHLGHKRTILKDDELILEILLPRPLPNHYMYEKIGGREALAISRISFAGIFEPEDGIVKRLAVAFGAVSDTVQRFRDIEEKIVGKTLADAAAMKDEYLKMYGERLRFTKGRVSASYRETVCWNILEAFWDKFVTVPKEGV